MDQLNIFGDCHNNLGLKIILSRFNNIISVGDIAAVDTREYLKRKEVYSGCWKYRLGKNIKVTKENLLWFDKLNINGWNKQIKVLNQYKKKLIVNMGNSDQRILSWYKLNRSKYLDIIKEIKLIKIDNIQILFLPYNTRHINRNILLKIKENDFIIMHMPPLKEYYNEVYNQLKQLNSLGIKLIGIHGHIHSDETYKYKIKDLENFDFITLKAEDTKDGFGYNHEIMSINTENSKFKFISLIGKEIKPRRLPEIYLKNKNHWNDFKI